MSNLQQLSKSKQSGIVSIMMTVIMMTVISLIVLGLAQISRREQRQSTDSQLSAQAFYAAESGVNDTITAIRNSAAGIPAKPNCAPSASAPYNTLSPDLGNGVSYPCVIVEPNPQDIPGLIGSTPQAYSLVTTSVAPSSITFKWTPPAGSADVNPASCPTSVANAFPADSGDWTCPYAVLRVDLINTAGSITRNSLVSGNKTVFLVPNAPGGTDNGFGSTSVRGATCSGATGECSYTFSGLGGGNGWYTRVSGLYGTGTLTISAGGGLKFANQVAIDVTGKAQDVLRRVKVTVNLSAGNQNDAAGGPIVSGDSVCKRFQTNQNGSASVDPCGP